MDTYTPDSEQVVDLLGYYTAGDGGGGEFYWDATSTDADNGGTIIKVTAITTGRWKRVEIGNAVIKFGAKIDGVTDDTQAFTDAVSVFPSTMIEVEPGTAVISSGTFTSNLFYSHGAFTSNNATVSVIDTTIDNTKRINYFTSNVTVTVGSGGDYATINEAIAYLSTMRPQYDSTNIKAEISLLTGFVMEEQVLTWGIDLSWITITGVDAETTIDGTYLTESPSTGLSAYNSTNRPAFGAYAGGKGPRVGQMFDMNGTATDTTQQRCGVVAYGSGSGIDVLPNCGVRRAGWYGVLASHNADVTAQESDFNSSLGRGIFANEGGRIEGNQIDVSGATSTAVHSSDAGFITCELADTSGSLIGLSANNAGRINGVGVDASNCTDTGVYSANGGFIHAQNATATGCDIGARALSGASINLDGADCSGATSFGVSAEQGSRINADNVNAQMGGSPAATDVRILTGSIINFSNGTGGVSTTVNTLTSAGIIFQ